MKQIIYISHSLAIKPENTEFIRKIYDSSPTDRLIVVFDNNSTYTKSTVYN